MRLSPILVLAAVLLAAAPAFADEPSPAPPASAQTAPAQTAPALTAPAPNADSRALREAGITPEIAQRLTNDQLYDILHQRAMGDHRGGEGTIVPISFFLFLFLGVSVGLYIGLRRDRERQETLRAVIQRGGTIPHELLVTPPKKFADLRRGIVLLAIGLGLSIFLAVMPTERGAWTAGLIPILLGGGYLLTWKLTQPGPQAIKDDAAVAAEREVNSL